MDTFRVVLVNLCEDSCGYGPSSSEYLRAELLATDDLAAQISVEILFLQGLTSEEAAERILEATPDFLGFTCFSWNLRESGEVSRLIRRRAPEVPIVWGGCSFSLFRERHDWFRWWDTVDAVAVGSGEYTLVDVVRHLIGQPLPRRIAAALPGLALHRDGSLEFGPPARLPTRLDDLASPYLRGTQHRCEQPFIEMARGCKFQCTFCSDARASRDGLYRAHSIERIAGEVAEVIRWPGVRWIDAGSSTANINDEEFAAVCEGIRRGDPEQRVAYAFQMYPGIARQPQRASLDGIRIDRLCFGVQSTTAETWGAIKRKTTLEHLARARAVFAGLGTLQASLLLGLPGETLASFRNTFNEVRTQGFTICVNRLLVLPGTQLHRDKERFHLDCDEDRYYRVLSSSTMTPDDLRRAQDFVLQAAAAEIQANGPGERPAIMWTNFDVQPTMFSPITIASVA